VVGWTRIAEIREWKARIESSLEDRKKKTKLRERILNSQALEYWVEFFGTEPELHARMKALQAQRMENEGLVYELDLKGKTP
jgi:hypothetical protein